MVASKHHRLAIMIQLQRKKIKTGEDGSYHTSQVGPGDRGRKNKKERILFGSTLDFSKVQGREL